MLSCEILCMSLKSSDVELPLGHTKGCSANCSKREAAHKQPHLGGQWDRMGAIVSIVSSRKRIAIKAAEPNAGPSFP